MSILGDTSVQVGGPTTGKRGHEIIEKKSCRKFGPSAGVQAQEGTIGENRAMVSRRPNRRKKGTLMDPKKLVSHLLAHLYRAQVSGTRLGLEELVSLIKVRRNDIRKTLTTMHQQDLLDVRTMRLTMLGFAMAMAVDGKALPVLRQPARSAIRAA